MEDSLSTTHDVPGPAAPSAPTAPAEKRTPEAIAAYHRAGRLCHLAGLVISLLYWACWLALAGGFGNWLEASTDSRWAGLTLAGLFMFGGSVLVHLPLDYYRGFLLEKQYELSNQTAAGWLTFQFKSWLVGAVIGGLLLSGLYALLWYGGAYWSVWLWIGVMAFSIGLAKIFPLVILPLFYPAKPLDRPSLTERLHGLASQAGMNLTGVFDLGLSKETKKANAMLAGLGSSRRVYLSDTLLAEFNDDEIAVVFAHELGHHIRKHIVKSIGMAAILTSLVVALIHWRLNPFAGSRIDWHLGLAGLAQVGFLLAVLPLLTGPITNAISRYFERQADHDALRLTGRPDAFRSAFHRLIDQNLADPHPPRWEVVMFDDHPPMAERLAMAEAWPSSS